MVFSRNNHCDLDLSPRTLKLEVVQDIVILNICVILNENRSINKGARATGTLTLTLSFSNANLFEVLSYPILV